MKRGKMERERERDISEKVGVTYNINTKAIDHISWSTRTTARVYTLEALRSGRTSHTHRVALGGSPCILSSQWSWRKPGGAKGAEGAHGDTW